MTRPTRARLVVTGMLLCTVSCVYGPRLSEQPGKVAAIRVPIPDPPPELVVFLVGDAGTSAAWSVLDSVAQRVQMTADSTDADLVVVFLGDNVYDVGLRKSTDGGYNKSDTTKLNRQIRVVGTTRARAVFVPGNHDWGHRDYDDGLTRVINQAEYLAEIPRAAHHPDGGCPGPEKLDHDRLRLIFLDTAWWLFPEEKRADCTNTTTDAVVAAIEDLMTSAGSREIVVAAHHPIASYGQDHGRGAEPQDINDEAYQDMIASLDHAYRAGPRRPLAHAAGHEHNLQVFEGGEREVDWVLVSGSAGKVSPVVDSIVPPRLAQAEKGYMELSFLPGGRVGLAVLTFGNGSEPLLAQCWLLRPEPARNVPDCRF